MITRVVGRSTVGELSTFQLILFITMGDMVQQAVTQQDYSITSGLLAVPVVIVRDGWPLDRVLRQERVSIDDLKAAARQQGFDTLADIRLAVLEANGQISLFSSQQGGQDGREG